MPDQALRTLIDVTLVELNRLKEQWRFISKDKAGFEENFLKATKKDIGDHGGKYLAGGYDKTLSLSGDEPPNRVVILQFDNMDAVEAWRDQGAMDMENTVGSKYAKFRIYAVEGVTQ